MRLEIVLLAAVFVAVLIWMARTQHRAAVRQRAAMFDACKGMLDQLRVQGIPGDCPTLKGRFRGHGVTVRALIDHVTFRKLPSVWLMVTVTGQTQYRGTLDILVRPQNTEFFSPSDELSRSISPPPGWPQHAAIRSDEPEAMPPADVIAPHLSFFEEPKAKELLVTPKGVRLVYHFTQAERSNYLVLREIRFRDLRIPPELLRSLLERAVRLHEDVAASGHAHGEIQAACA